MTLTVAVDSDGAAGWKLGTPRRVNTDLTARELAVQVADALDRPGDYRIKVSPLFSRDGVMLYRLVRP
jgi:hypothetical protein